MLVRCVICNKDYEVKEDGLHLFIDMQLFGSVGKAWLCADCYDYLKAKAKDVRKFYRFVYVRKGLGVSG